MVTIDKKAQPFEWRHKSVNLTETRSFPPARLVPAPSSKKLNAAIGVAIMTMNRNQSVVRGSAKPMDRLVL